MPDSHALLLSVVTRLLDDPVIPARLLALGDAAAVLAMADGSLAALFTPAYGPPEELGAKLRALVEDNPGAHLKLAIVGGGAAVRELLPADGGGLFSRRAVQAFHLGPAADGEWAVWTGGGARTDSPLGMVLAAAGRGELPAAPERAALAQRVDRPPPLSPEERARVSEGQAFIASLRTRPRVTWGVLAVLAAIFVLEELWGGSETVPTLVRMGGNTGATLAGEPWRLLSSAMLHGGWFHAGVNGFALLVLGSFVERVFGAARYGVLLGLAAMGGALATALSSAPLSVGASGALCGALGAAAVLSWRPGEVIPAVMVGQLRRSAVINLVLVSATSFHPQVDGWAHLGGGLVGAALVLGGVLTRGVARPGSRPARGSRGFAIAAWLMAGLAAASLAAAWISGRPWALVSEPAWARHSLGEISLEVPALLGEPAVARSEPGVGVWTFGDPLWDPLLLTVVVELHGLDEVALRERVLELERSEDGPAVPADAHASTPWHRRTGEGPPTFEVEYAFDDGQRMSLLLQIRERTEVWIKSERWPALAARWSGPVQRVHASLADAQPR